MGELTRIMTDVKSGPLPPVFFLGGLLLQWGLHISLPIARLVPEAWAPLGTIPIVVGLGVVVVAALQFVPPALAWLLSRRFMKREEAALSQTFGEDYERYKSRVRRWF